MKYFVSEVANVQPKKINFSDENTLLVFYCFSFKVAPIMKYSVLL